ncbi:4Fe-4S dicluster domain-containing protein [Candidatus Azobacteroides pseudotrichonymphae]|uniref:Hydrogenase 4Fe-4S binding subunit n=1 Tax=Azobacteroides pseudotrichonymphae genomovar. CFP2 TaxID=511995 RepID=B6YQN3_AZOPC|nr:4Fe-4S dicluster domain-containing protein [Candidatus Azobacteroides pseudotrichonymphae]BAG83505.1 putative hydrogenase 4Fe-4S binding subunit [Candidatus Azobacteroides pseudotrichonymphae genomovar. CFP2]
MDKINKIATKLLATGKVQIIIGYTEGSKGRIRPFFARNEEECRKLIFDERCVQNLAVFLYKKEVSQKGQQAIVSNVHTLRGIIRLAAEKQIKEGDLIAIAVSDKEQFLEVHTLEAIENYLSDRTFQLNESDEILLDKLNAMNPLERWIFWQNEMKNCIRCYACRQACPLCYCSQCVVEINQPQWIPVFANKIGNTEWHIMRAMHLAGRCVECGQCGRVCPENIPIHLLPIRLAREIKALYGSTTGISKDENCEISTYKYEDRENFFE